MCYYIGGNGGRDPAKSQASGFQKGETMNKVSTQAQVTVLSREQAIARAGWILAEAREKLAELYGWILAGEATSWIAPVLLARDVQEALGEVRALALAFSTPGDGFSESMTVFLEKARLEAARILRERGANQPRPALEEEVPF